MVSFWKFVCSIQFIYAINIYVYHNNTFIIYNRSTLYCFLFLVKVESLLYSLVKLNVKLIKFFQNFCDILENNKIKFICSENHALFYMFTVLNTRVKQFLYAITVHAFFTQRTQSYQNSFSNARNLISKCEKSNENIILISGNKCCVR